MLVAVTVAVAVEPLVEPVLAFEFVLEFELEEPQEMQTNNRHRAANVRIGLRVLPSSSIIAAARDRITAKPISSGENIGCPWRVEGTRKLDPFDTVKVVVALPFALSVSGFGLKLQLTPVGKPVHAKFTVPENPPTDVAVMVAVPGVALETVMFDAEDDR